MAAPAVRGGGFVCRRAPFLAALALLAALCAAPATRQACAEVDQKVWRALTEEGRRGPPPAVPGGRGGSAAQASRDSVLAYVVSGIVVAVFSGIVVAVLASARRLRQAPAKPRPADLEAGSDIERIWSHHLTRKRRKRGQTV